MGNEQSIPEGLDDKKLSYIVMQETVMRHIYENKRNNDGEMIDIASAMLSMAPLSSKIIMDLVPRMEQDERLQQLNLRYDALKTECQTIADEYIESIDLNQMNARAPPYGQDVTRLLEQVVGPISQLANRFDELTPPNSNNNNIDEVQETPTNSDDHVIDDNVHNNLE